MSVSKKDPCHLLSSDIKSLRCVGDVRAIFSHKALSKEHQREDENRILWRPEIDDRDLLDAVDTIGVSGKESRGGGVVG